MDEQIVTQVEGQISIEVLVELEAQQVSAHIESPDYATIADASLIASFITTIATIVISQEEGDNGHTQTIIEVQ